MKALKVSKKFKSKPSTDSFLEFRVEEKVPLFMANIPEMVLIFSCHPVLMIVYLKAILFFPISEKMTEVSALNFILDFISS